VLDGVTNTRARPAPVRARLLASVPPLVNTTCAGRAPTSAATCSRAVSSSARAARPKPCTDDGFPTVASASVMAAATAGRTGAVAL